MYSKILVPIDGSATALRGLTEACALAKALRSKIKLVHVVNELVTDYTLAPSVYYERVIQAVRAAGQNALTDARAHATKLELDVESELVETIGVRASTSIVESARQWHADLIVMGTHGRRGLQRLALGSDAEMVLRTSPVPVLMVRSPA